MATATSVERKTGERPSAGHRRLAINAFFAILRRDILVTVRDVLPFLLQSFMQPILFVFIFGKVLPSIGLASPHFASLMLPGMTVFTGMMAAIYGVMFPLVFDLGFAREIDDRLLSPLPVKWVAVEKILFGTIRGTAASAIIFPLGWLILGSGFAMRTDRIFEMIGMIILSAMAGSALGLFMGTVAKPDTVNVLSALLLPPLLFTGCTYYPWNSLKNIRWFQILTLFNPLTYASEGMRWAMVPTIKGFQIQTLDMRWILLALVMFVLVMRRVGSKVFYRRVVS